MSPRDRGRRIMASIWPIVVLLIIPLGLDLYLPAPEDNPLTHDRVELGRQLFNDRRLSRDDDGFTICKWMFRSERSEPGGIGWSTDYPFGEINLLTLIGMPGDALCGR